MRIVLRHPAQILEGATMAECQDPKKKFTVPKSVALLVGQSPPLLPDEEEDDWYDLFNAMTEEIAPTTHLEWFAVNDVVDILWDMSRLRLWKHATLVIGRHRALETALLQTQSSAMPRHLPSRITLAKQEAEQWRTNPERRAVLQARLNEAGYDIDGLNAGAMMEALVPLAAIDRFLCSARGQLNATLKELGVQRKFAERARKAFDERIAIELKGPHVKQIETRQ
jgi:hypothetical protein